MQKPTYQQMSEIYKELWQLQRDYENAISERDMFRESCKQESQYTDYLMQIILKARDALNTRDFETLKKELNKV